MIDKRLNLSEGWYKRFVTPTAFACEGKAILDNADEVSISITRYLDKAEDPSSGRGRILVLLFISCKYYIDMHMQLKGQVGS